MKIAVLGPSGTFSESALNEYLIKTNKDFERAFYNSIPLTFLAIGKECEIGIVPVENTLDGYVQRSLDMLLEQDLKIIDEVIIPIQFSLITNVKYINDIKKVYVQFKAHGQCLKFINSLSDVEIVTTQSNTESFDLFKADNSKSCAIIPNHLYYDNGHIGIENVTDSKNNYTRFFIIQKEQMQIETVNNELRISLYVIPNTDEAGLLYKILENFSKNKINLCSIISRPTKKNLGTYNFYIEISSNINDKTTILKTLDKMKTTYNIKILGIW